MQLELNFEEKPATIALSDLFEAYYLCRKNKRKTTNAIKFELNYEEELVRLWKDINAGTYRIGRSIAFIVDKPVKREIFAADFRDRIVHHLIINKFMHLFEKNFIHDSYSCRKGRGTLFGVKRVSRFIRACSNNYTKPCYYLKMDIQGFFMSIRRDILFDKLLKLICNNYHEADRAIFLWLIEMVVMNDCTAGCVVKSPRRKWDGLPRNKTLFGQRGEPRGLPIGNLTSQIFANFYLNAFDHYIKSKLGIRYYARYVDDFVLIHNDKEYLKSLIEDIRCFLDSELNLTLHPKKIVFRDCTKGMKFIGAYLLPHRIYIEKRTKNNFYRMIHYQNIEIRKDRKQFDKAKMEHFQSSVNSYLGFMRHYKTFRLRKKLCYFMSARFDRYLRPANAYTKLAVK